jgi:hypothetical protein
MRQTINMRFTDTKNTSMRLAAITSCEDSDITLHGRSPSHRDLRASPSFNVHQDYALHRPLAKSTTTATP